MHPLLAAQALTEPSADADRVVAALQALAALPPGERWPAFDGVAGVARHPDPRIRARAVATLAGASGLPAERIVLAALHDGDGGVRQAGVEALVGLAGGDPSRWLHAVAHPEATVRAQAAARAPGEALELWLPLLCEEGLREGLMARVEGLGLPPELGPAVARHGAAGHLDDAGLLRLVAALPWRREPEEIVQAFWPPGLAASADLSPAALPAVAAALAHERPGPAGLVTLLCRLGAADPAGLARVLDPVVDRVRNGAVSFSAEQRLRLGVAAWLGAHPGQAPHPSVLALALPAAPALLGLLDPTQAAPALALLAGARRKDIHRLRLDELGGAHLAGPPGALDLRAAAGLLGLCRPGCLEALAALHDEETLVAAILADPEGGARLLSGLPEDDLGGQALARRLLALALRPDASGHPPVPAGSALLAAAWARQADLVAPTMALCDPPFLARVLVALDARAAAGRLKEQRQATITAAVLAGAPASTGGPLLLVRTLLVDHGLRGPMVQRLAVEALRAADAPLALLALGDQGLRALYELDHDSGCLPWALVQGLAEACRRPPDEEVAAWLGVATRPEPRRRKLLPGAARALTEEEADRIATCRDEALARAVAPALAAPVTGLCAALALRPAPGRPQPEVCAALLCCKDPLPAVAALLARMGALDPACLRRIDSLLVADWAARPDMGPAAAAWLHRWDLPFELFVADVLAQPDGLRVPLHDALSLPVPALRAALWAAARHLLGRWRFREPGRLAERAPPALVEDLVAVLADTGAPGRGPLGFPVDRADRGAVQLEACKMLALLRTGGVDLSAWRDRVVAALPELPDLARSELEAWISSKGVTRRRAAPAGPVAHDATERILAATSAEELVPFCLLPARGVAELAVLALLEHGEEGARALLGLLLQPEAPHKELLGESVAHWPAGPTVDRARSALSSLRSTVADQEARFHLALGLCERGEGGAVAAAVQALLAPAEEAWLGASALQRLRTAADPDALALALVESPQPVATTWAVGRLLPRAAAPEVAPALRRFLLRLAPASAELRVQAAQALRDQGDLLGLPLILADAFHRVRAGQPPAARGWARSLPAPALLSSTRAALLAGDELAPGPAVVAGLAEVSAGPGRDGGDPGRDAAALHVLREVRAVPVQASALGLLDSRAHRHRAAVRLAELFLWGRDQGRRLLGGRYRVQMIGGEGLGWTRLDSKTVHVNPLPLLRGERDGAAIVRGLIVHELGHHLYHNDAQGQAVWKRAEAHKLQRLHNLVCDEHLERNLRSLSAEYGDDLKRLGAWAFHHARREVPAVDLVRTLGPAAVPTLVAAGLGPARLRGAVAVGAGALLRGLEAQGDRFGRFVRALRTGLGDRHGDPLVAQALALFDKGFRKRDNDGLWEVTLALRELFGERCELLDLVDLHESTREGEGEGLCEGRGLSDEEVEREVERLDLDRSRPTSSGEPRRGRPAKDVVNVGAREDFDRIHTVQVLERDPAAEAALAAQVVRPARVLRALLTGLGLSTVPVRPRVAGHRLDRSRLLPLTVRRDPRVLISRRIVRHTDLFLGLVIDCSGSMTGHRMERARGFAALVAAACKGLPGVDVRLFGFTDAVIKDAGTAERCAAHALEAGGGNNDAAGLHHAAQVALHSGRSARVLVMVSDGLPTECSTTALRALVRHLERRKGLRCAQVAVAPLHERCFDRYIEVLDDDADRAARAFGKVVGRLVAQALG